MRAFRSFLQHLLANPPPDPAPQKDGWFGWVDNFIPGSPKGTKGGKKGGKSSRANSSNNLEKQVRNTPPHAHEAPHTRAPCAVPTRRRRTPSPWLAPLPPASVHALAPRAAGERQRGRDSSEQGGGRAGGRAERTFRWGARGGRTRVVSERYERLERYERYERTRGEPRTAWAASRAAAARGDVGHGMGLVGCAAALGGHNRCAAAAEGGGRIG